MTAVPIGTCHGGFINLAVVLTTMEEEIMKLLNLAGVREPLTSVRRIREFQRTLQRVKNGEDVRVSGFLIGRKPPYAPADALYCLLSPVPPSELIGLSEKEPRAYLVLKITERTELRGEVKPGRYVAVEGILDAYRWGNLRMMHSMSIEGRDYSEYWFEYKNAALSRDEVENLLSQTLYIGAEMQRALTYALYGTPVVLGAPGNWREGVEFAVYRYKAENELLGLWTALKYLHSLIPWELRLRRERFIEGVDPFLDLDMRLGNPNSNGLRYFVPYSKRGLRGIPKWASRELMYKRAVGLLPENRNADPTEMIARVSEAPFVLVPWEEKPYYERNREMEELIPNLVAAIFLGRSRVNSMNPGTLEDFRRKFIRWQEEKRGEYGKNFEALISPSGLMNPSLRYHLSVRLFGSAARFEGGPKRSISRDILRINDAVVNDWMTVLRNRPDVAMRLLKEYERYIPRDVRANRALRMFNDLASTSPRGEVTREEFLTALLDAGFSRADAGEIIERFIAAGYVYEPFPGRLRLVK